MEHFDSSLKSTSDLEILIEEARNPKTTRLRLWILVNEPSESIRKALLDNPQICPISPQGMLDVGLFTKLAELFPREVEAHAVFVLHTILEPVDEMWPAVTHVVTSTNDLHLIEHFLESSYGRSFWQVREAIAKNPRTSTEILTLLGNPATEDEREVREAVANNPNTPVDVLRALGNQEREPSWRVRESVARHPSTPVDVLKILGNEATERNISTRVSVATNENTPDDVLDRLMDPGVEQNPDVRKSAMLSRQMRNAKAKLLVLQNGAPLRI